MKCQSKTKRGTFPARKCETSRKTVGGELGGSYAKTLPTLLSLQKKGFKAFPRLNTTQKLENGQFI